MKYRPPRERGLGRANSEERRLAEEATRLLAAAGYDMPIEVMRSSRNEVPLDEARRRRRRDPVVMDAWAQWLRQDDERKRRGTAFREAKS